MVLTGAASPESITHCFVLKGAYLAYAMLEGEKVYGSDPRDEEPVAIKSKNIENRQGRLAPGWYGRLLFALARSCIYYERVILGKGTKGVNREEYDKVRTLLPDMTTPPWGHSRLKEGQGKVVGVVKIEHSLPNALCKDSAWAIGPVCNIISRAGWLGESVSCKGNLGACPIPDKHTRDRVRAEAAAAMEANQIFRTNGEVEHPYRGPDVWEANRKRKGAVNMSDCDDFQRLFDFVERNCKKFKARIESSASN